MTIQLLTNEEMVKGLMPVSDNLAGEYLATAMLEAQEIGLKGILGQTLLTRLKECENGETWDEYPEYEELKAQCQMYLAYKTIQEVLPKVAFKITNAGAVQTSDTNVANLSREQIDAMIEDYSAKADAFAYQLQLWLRKAVEGDTTLFDIGMTDADGKTFICSDGTIFKVRGEGISLPAEDCNEIKANLYSAASCGLWLGGARGWRI